MCLGSCQRLCVHRLMHCDEASDGPKNAHRMSVSMAGCPADDDSARAAWPRAGHLDRVVSYDSVQERVNAGSVTTARNQRARPVSRWCTANYPRAVEQHWERLVVAKV